MPCADADLDWLLVSESDAKRKGEDVLLVHSPTDDGRGWRVLRKREERLELGAIRPVEEGRPIQGELVSLKPRDGTPLFDVEVQYAPPRSSAGPARVSSDAYRSGWDAIFGDANEAEASSPREPGRPLPN